MKPLERLYTDIAVLSMLVKGCKHHRSYRAVVKPRAECPECENLFTARLALKKAGYDL